MEEYYLWILVGGLGAILLVLLSYMGCFSWVTTRSVSCRKVACNAEEMEELILALTFRLFLISSYSNIEAPYTEMERQSHELKKRLAEALGDANAIGKGVNVYYDDPRFSPKSGFL